MNPGSLRTNGCAAATLAWLAVALISTPAHPQDRTTSAATTGRLVHATVHSPGLEDNLLGDSPNQRVSVYLPPGYDAEPERRYPALYLLHGFGGSPRDWTGSGYGMTIQGMMDSLVAVEAIREMIVVIPNGSNRYQGSFYMNSPVTGDWEDWIARDLVSHVDREYRTIARAGGRGVAGHSMGGYGAIWLAMRRPDVFSAAYALSPGVLGMAADIGPGNPVWGRMDRFTTPDQLDSAYAANDIYPMAVVAVAAVYSPNPEEPPLYVDLPFTDDGRRRVALEPAYSLWRASLPVALIDDYREGLLGLRALHLDYGAFDQFSHIQVTTREFSRALAERGIPHVFEVFEGDHRDRMPWRMAERVLPLFSRVLDFEP